MELQSAYQDLELSELDNELASIKKISEALSVLDAKGQQRVLKWAVTKFMDENSGGAFEMGMIVKEKVDRNKIAELEKTTED